jgi:hypothetical protein
LNCSYRARCREIFTVTGDDCERLNEIFSAGVTEYVVPLTVRACSTRRSETAANPAEAKARNGNAIWNGAMRGKEKTRRAGGGAGTDGFTFS